MNRNDRIKNAILDWRDNAPQSLAFDDVYFSGDGIEEARHVFLGGNDLPARLGQTPQFVIGELGFGTGLNFLAAWQAWTNAPKPANAVLHFLSFEALPLAHDDMTRAHAAWPELAALSEKLRAGLPPPVPGFHRIDLERDVTLTLYYGDALDGLKRTEASVDAWFFDGFAPAKNPAMWSPGVFAETARLSSTGATFATFTVAGSVRRTLETAGFGVEKRPGFGRKREMSAGRLVKPKYASRRRPWFDTREKAKLNSGAHVTIIGAGIAGASLAYALGRAGYRVTVYEAEKPASGASGNPAGLIMPRLDADDTPAARFHKTAYLYAIALLSAVCKTSSEKFYNPCGVMLYAADEKERRRQEKLFDASALPPEWLELREDGLFFPQGGVVDPAAFVRALLGKTEIRREKIVRLKRDGVRWLVVSENGETCVHDAVVVANALEVLRFEQLRSLPLAGSAGQVDWFPEAPALEHAHAFGPYAAPAPKGGIVTGATYAPIAIGAEPAFAAEATKSNINTVRRTLPALAQYLDDLNPVPRAGVRCTTPDRLPVAGPVPDWGFYGGAYDGLRQGRKTAYPPGEVLPGLYVLTGLGSRGLVTAPLAAAMIAAEIAGATAPVDFETAEALHPARFFIRDLKRARTG